jgi:hypothetical protein
LTLHKFGTLDTFHVRLVTSPFQQRIQPSIAVARLPPRQLHQFLAQFDDLRLFFGRPLWPLAKKSLIVKGANAPQCDDRKEVCGEDERDFVVETVEN